jgi:hypothetical protein
VQGCSTPQKRAEIKDFAQIKKLMQKFEDRKTAKMNRLLNPNPLHTAPLADEGDAVDLQAEVSGRVVDQEALRKKKVRESAGRRKSVPQVKKACGGTVERESDFVPAELSKGAARKINPYAGQWGRSYKSQIAGVRPKMKS